MPLGAHRYFRSTDPAHRRRPLFRGGSRSVPGLQCGVTLRRWLFAGVCVVSVVFVVMGVLLLQWGKPGYGWALIAAAVLNVGGYVWDWGQKRRRASGARPGR